MSFDGLFFLDEPLIAFEPDCILDDLLADCNNINNNSSNNYNNDISSKSDAPSNKGSKKRQRKPSSQVVLAAENKDDDNNLRNNNESSSSLKVLHRDIERQRRREMASLYASLRSLLPLEYVKGKRAISDHMHEAASYIRDLRKKTEEMKKNREMLKKRVSGIESSGFLTRNQPRKSAATVKVSPCLAGLEILIIISDDCLNGVEEEEVGFFPLSKVLVELVQRGIDVIICTSTRANKQLLNKIQIQADNLGCIDPSELQEKLVNLINLA